jgi:Fe-S-cluster containining protein
MNRPATPPPRSFTAADVAKTVHHAATQVLRQGRAPAQLAEAVAAAKATAERFWGLVQKSVEREGAIACRSGCAWCCYQGVAVIPIEAVAIARHVEARFSAAERGALDERLARAQAQTAGLSMHERARLMLACPFLVEGRCSIYEVRPFRCRGIHSRDADYCKWKLENIDEAVADPRRGTPADPLLQAPVQIMDAGLAGLGVACQDAGLAGAGLELTGAIQIALATPDRDQRFAAGDDLFAAAALPASES